MDRFTELETFIAVAEAGGFNAAARRLNRSPPSVTRIISGLEQRIGTRLFTRTTRQIAFTEAGERLFTDARRLVNDLEIAEASAAGAHQEPQGVLSVTAPTIFGRVCIAPVLRSFLDLNPRVSVQALFVDRIVNLIEEGLDVAVRIGELPDSSLTAVRVGAVRHVVVASPAYLQARGRPEMPEHLTHHRLVSASQMTQADSWQFVAAGQKRSVPIRAAFVANNIDVSIDAALSGWAVTRVLSYQVADALRSGKLVELLPGFEDREIPIHLVHAEGPLRAAKIRVFVDHAAQALRKQAQDWVG